MTASLLHRPVARRLERIARDQRWIWERRLRRARVALAFLTGRVSEDYGRDLLRAGCEALESWSLVSLDADGVLRAAEDRWGPHPELPRLCAIAAHHVARKWSDDGETRGAAEDWALRIVREDAEMAGIRLVAIEEDDA